MHLPLANLFGIEQWGIIALVALLLFGKRLPEVGRSLGKGIIEFKKGLQGVEEDINQSGNAPPPQRPALTSNPEGYKFDPYTGKPLEPAQPQMRYDPYTGKPLSQDSTTGTASS